jgi:hypothetical protein
VLASHDDVPKSSFALQWLHQEISQQLFRGTILYAEPFSLEPVFDEKIGDVDVPKIWLT